MTKLVVVFLVIFPKLVYVLIVSSKITLINLRQKLCPLSLLLPPPPELKFQTLVPPFFVVPPIDL